MYSYVLRRQSKELDKDQKGVLPSHGGYSELYSYNGKRVVAKFLSYLKKINITRDLLLDFKYVSINIITNLLVMSLTFELIKELPEFSTRAKPKCVPFNSYSIAQSIYFNLSQWHPPTQSIFMKF